ncbi:MAG: class I tRNA ligase family protein, partial [Pseudomonadota bacterium]|nr:class I tRNA ligase family protein [Pseudomonadota bacterium]
MIDYRDTVFLPKTDFPMRAGLPKKEPEIMARWDAIGMYERIMKERADAPAWILHDGPPYANGHIHAGTAGNKILKDIVLRIQTMRGFRCPYVPGWDCHGLPIEWKVEEAYRSEGKNKETLSIAKVRSDCREFAKNWLDIQRGEFKRLGGFGDWDNPYTTMTFENEARITAEIHKFACSGALYRGVKPILWSVVEGTALAEAETEYYDHKSPTIEVRFPVAAAACSKIEGADIVIWTTTPWTIPGNRALACGPDFAYGVYEVTEAGEDATAQKGDRLVLMTALAEGVRTRAKIVAWTKIADLTGEDLVGTVCRHPFAGQGYDFDVPVLSADFVTEDTGTGFVHIAPGHGADDYVLGMKNGIDVPETVGPDGLFLDDVPLFAGQAVLTDDGKDGPANGAVIKALFACKKLLAKGSLVHSYPHSWRSKAPLIFRATPQWFISMKGLRSNAMAAIDEIRFHPPQSRNRIRSMVENRPDWCISRQRAWGVPIAIFVHKKTRSILTDPAVLKRTVDLFRSDGADAWFT